MVLLLRPMLLWYRNQSIYYHCKSIDWLLHEESIDLKLVKLYRTGRTHLSFCSVEIYEMNFIRWVTMSINKKVIINTKEFFTHCFCFQCFFVLLIMVVVGEGYLRVPYIPYVSSQARHITNSDMLTRLVIMRCEYLCIMKSILQPYPHGRLPLKVKI